MPEIAGVRLATGAAGIKYKGRTDVLLALFDKGTTVAGVLTRSKCPSAPVEWCRAKLKGGKARALVVNSGNANAFTGKTGREATAFTAKLAAQAAGCKPAEVFLASTGVIGEPLTAQRVRRRDGRAGARSAAPGRFLDAAKAIMTTDTFPKVATAQAKLGDATVTINGIAKGAGMIAPDMATMLSFVFTDAPIAAPALQAIVSGAVVDTLQCRDDRRRHLDLGHAARVRDRRGAQARRRSRAPSDPKLKAFPRGVRRACSPISSEQIARDGEGARKLVEIVVEGATSKTLGAAHRAVDRQLAAGQDRDRRRGRQLGPRRHGGRQGRRAGRPRQTVDLVRRHPRGAQGCARSRLRRGGGLELHEIAGNHPEGRARDRQRRATGCSPATSPRNTSRSTATTGRNRRQCCRELLQLMSICVRSFCRMR